MNKALAQKAFAIAALTIVILIALYMVGGVIDDRQRYRDAAVHSIEASYAGPQTLIGPVLVRPYTETMVTTEVNAKGIRKTNTSKRDLAATICPRELELHGAMLPNTLRHGLYKVEVYELNATLKGRIEIADPPTEGTIAWGEPYLALSVADVRGIAGTPKVLVNGVPEPMLQGAPATSGWQPNLRIPLRGMTALKGSLDFDLELNLDGTETLNIAPVADSNRFYIQSSWRSPLFAGQFLPGTRDIDDGGFNAAWNISSLASGTQSQLLANPSKAIDTVSVTLTTLVDPYTLSDRATKYGILFVTLTFGGFLLFELMKQLPIHPVQYLLVGFGLAIFFLLLVSFSEHMAFALAYVIASLACIGLLTFYLAFVLRSTARGLGFGIMLTTLYSTIYGLLISEDNALVLGSLMLFLLLAAVMFITRKIDWYKGAAALLHTDSAIAEIPGQPSTSDAFDPLLPYTISQDTHVSSQSPPRHPHLAFHRNCGPGSQRSHRLSARNRAPLGSLRPSIANAPPHGRSDASSPLDRPRVHRAHRNELQLPLPRLWHGLARLRPPRHSGRLHRALARPCP